MAAALQLLRARRQVLIIDAGQRRNRFASHSHGFLTQDGADPAEIANRAREQLSRYGTLSWIDRTAERAEGTRDAFKVTLADGNVAEGNRLLFATGVSDALPDVEGLAERWGRSVFQCPYCYGYELEQGRLGVIATGAGSLHQALFLPEWGDVTLMTNGALSPGNGERAELRQPRPEDRGTADCAAGRRSRCSIGGWTGAVICGALHDFTLSARDTPCRNTRLRIGGDVVRVANQGRPAEGDQRGRPVEREVRLFTAWMRPVQLHHIGIIRRFGNDADDDPSWPCDPEPLRAAHCFDYFPLFWRGLVWFHEGYWPALSAMKQELSFTPEAERRN